MLVRGQLRSARPASRHACNAMLACGRVRSPKVAVTALPERTPQAREPKDAWHVLRDHGLLCLDPQPAMIVRSVPWALGQTLALPISINVEDVLPTVLLVFRTTARATMVPSQLLSTTWMPPHARHATMVIS